MRLVLLGHNATRSGAPIVFLSLLRWLRGNTEARVTVVLRGGGDLLRDYEALANTIVVGNPPSSHRRLASWAASKIHDRGRVENAKVVSTSEALQVCSTADLVYANTIATAALLRELDGGPRSILHLHEMRYALHVLTHKGAHAAGTSVPEHLADTLAHVDAVVVPSRLAEQQVVDMVPSASTKCHVIPEMIDVAAASRPATDAAAVRRQLSIPPTALVVIGCGTVEWRKGTDLFVQAAAEVLRTTSVADVHFIWLGAQPQQDELDRQRIEIEFDIAGMGLSNRVHLLPATTAPAAYLAASDVFLLSSREDPFPLVVLEAAATGTPIVCFDTVGIAEFVDCGNGISVPYLNVSEMASAVCTLIESPSERRRAGNHAAKAAENYDTSVVAPKLFKLISSIADHPGV